MLVPVNTAYGQQFISECLSNGRNIQVFAKFVADAAGDGTSTNTTYDQSQIKSINLTSTVCNGEYTVGNVPTQTLNLSIFTNAAIPIKYPGDWQNDTKSVWENNWIEIFFAPNAGTYSFTKSEVNSLGYGYNTMANHMTLPAKWRHIVRLGVYYVTNTHFNPDGVQEIEAVDYSGALLDDEYVSTIVSYPARVRDVITDVITQIGGEDYDAGLVIPNGNMQIIQNELVGYSCREVLQMCLACCGANFYKYPGETNTATTPDSFLHFDRYFSLSYPGRFSPIDFPSYGDNLADAIDYCYTNGYIADVPASSILKLSNQYPQIKIGAVQYGDTLSYGSGIQPGSKYNLIIQQNPILDSLNSTQLYNVLTNLADVYKNFSYVPVSLDIVSCPVLELLDYVYFHDRYGGEYGTMIMSENVSNPYGMSISSGGNSVGTNNPTSQKQNVKTERITIKASVDELSAASNELSNDFYYVSGDTFTGAIFGVGGFVTSSLSTLDLYFVLPKSLKNISTITVSTLKGRAISSNGSIDGSTSLSYDWLATGYTATATKRSDNTIRIQIVKTTDMTNAANRLPVTFIVGTISLQFS